MSQENVEVIRRMFEAWSLTPNDPPLEYFDPAVEWQTRWPGLPDSYHGHDGIRRWAGDVVEPMAMEIGLVDVRPVDAGRVLVEYHAHGTGRESGVDVDMRIFDVVLLRDGLILRRETFYDRTEALEALGLSG